MHHPNFLIISDLKYEEIDQRFILTKVENDLLNVSDTIKILIQNKNKSVFSVSK